MKNRHERLAFSIRNNLCVNPTTAFQDSKHRNFSCRTTSALTFSATYDQDYDLTNRTVSGGIYNHTYDTDANGNITQVGGADYGYDTLNRLDEEDDGTAITYSRNAAGQLATVNTTGGVYRYNYIRQRKKKVAAEVPR